MASRILCQLRATWNKAALRSAIVGAWCSVYVPGASRGERHDVDAAKRSNPPQTSTLESWAMAIARPACFPSFSVLSTLWVLASRSLDLDKLELMIIIPNPQGPLDTNVSPALSLLTQAFQHEYYMTCHTPVLGLHSGVKGAHSMK